MYSATFAWTIKLSIALTMILSGYMLNWAGYDASLEATQGPGVVERLRLLYMTVPVGLGLLGLVFVFLYPLDETRSASIRAQLAAR
jgi:Na+/melibiose symporter-like transporter